MKLWIWVLCTIVAGAVAAVPGGAAAQPSGPSKTVSGGHLSAKQLERLITEHHWVRLSKLAVTGTPKLAGAYRLEASRVRFTGGLSGDINAHQTLELKSSRFDDAFTFRAANECPGCRFEVVLEGSRLNDAMVVAGRGGGVAMFLTRVKVAAPSTIDGIASFVCQRCAIDSNLTFRDLRAKVFTLADTSGAGSLTVTGGRIEQLLSTGSRFEQPVDLERATIDQFDLECLPSQTVFVRWEQFGEAWVDRRVKEANGDKLALNRLRREALCWKANLEATGRGADATDANHAAIKIDRDHILSRVSLGWLAAWALELPNGYGTDPYRPLLISLVVVLICALVYALADPFVEKEANNSKPKKPVALFALLFSIETFVPVLQVTGIKDWGWQIDESPLRWLESLEGLAGGVLTLVAAYSVASYVF